MKWYRISAPDTHQGAGSEREQTIYLYCDSAIDALDRYRHLSGVRRTKLSGVSLRELSPEEIAVLEDYIVRERKFRIEDARAGSVRCSPKKGFLAPI